MSKLTIDNEDGSTVDFDIPANTDAQSITIDGVKLSTVVGLRTGLRRQMWVLAASAATFCVCCVAILSFWTHREYGTPNNTRDEVIAHLDLRGTPNNTRDEVIAHLNQLHAEVAELATKHGTPDNTKDAIIATLASMQAWPPAKFPIGARVRAKQGEAIWTGTVINTWQVVGGKGVTFPSHTFGRFSNGRGYSGRVYDVRLDVPIVLQEADLKMLSAKETNPGRRALAEKIVGHEYRYKLLTADGAVYGVSVPEGSFFAIVE